MPNLTSQQLEQHLRGTPLAGQGGNFIRYGQQFRVDPRLLVSIASAESSLGKYASGHNPFGWGPGIHFSSWDEAIRTVANGLRTNYLNRGLKTIGQIGQKYAPQNVANDPTGLNSNWVRNVRSMYQSLGGSGALGAGGRSSPQAAGSGGLLAPLDLRKFVSGQMAGNPAQGNRPWKPTEELENLVQEVRSSPQSQQQTRREQASPNVRGRLGKLTFSSGADRAGVHTQADVIAFARRVAAVYGHPLRVGTGTNHSQMTVNGRESQHWTGHAVDIPASGQQLLRMGRAALIAAGMPWRQAMRQTGGLYNVGGRQIIFLTNEGGDHYNHLHLGA